MSSLTKSRSTEVVRDLPGFWSLMANTEQRTLQSLPSDRARLVSKLSPIEIATIRCAVAPLDELAPDYSTLSRAGAFLSAWEARGRLHHLSGYGIAWELTGAMFALHPFRGFGRGLQLLADLDGATGLGVFVTCSTLRPDPRGIDRYKRVRLTERLNELAA